MGRIALLERQIRELAAATYPAPPGCDMGDCDGDAAGLIWSAEHGWLPACAEHLREPWGGRRSTGATGDRCDVAGGAS
jgi:hypothetical protein